MIRKGILVAAMSAMSFLGASFLSGGIAFAQAPGECSGGFCGTPKQSGGGGCGCGGGSILVNFTDLGDTYQYADDFDTDGVEDDYDNCPFKSNQNQLDSDGDKVGDSCDNCLRAGNEKQEDADADGLGNACDVDMDNDGLPNTSDKCQMIPNPGQEDADNDGQGNACDTDDDNDGVLDVTDNCALIANPDQLNSDPNTYGEACDSDLDKDNIDDSRDNCVNVPNQDQANLDNDSLGNACDSDKDGDGIVDTILGKDNKETLLDNCPLLGNLDQKDSDRDGMGDACDARFCFVVDGDAKNCLDPLKTFAVYSPDKLVTPENLKEPSEGEFRLRLFANRTNVPIRYKWIVESAPEGSTATVINPEGTVTQSSPFEYFYIKNNIPTFKPDMAGEYKIKIESELIFADTVNANFPKKASYIMSVKSEGEGSGSGCAVGTTSSSGTLILLLSVIGLAVLRRTR